MEKPYSPSCDRNKEPILEKLTSIIADHHRRLFEVGSGTGQHAVFLAPHFPNLEWITSEPARHHAGLRMWLRDSSAKNIKGPIHFEVGKDDFYEKPVDVVFTANTLHIMSWKQNKYLFKMLGNRLRRGAQVLIYGPFNYGGQFTSDGNRDLDEAIKKLNPDSGIRHFEDVKSALEKRGFSLVQDHAMPNNNRLLQFEREEHRSMTFVED